MMVDGVGHLADEASRDGVEGGGEAISAKEVTVAFQPTKEADVLFQGAEHAGGGDAEEEADGASILVGIAGGILETGDILVEGIAGGDLVCKGNDATGILCVDGDDHAVGLHFL